MAPSEAKTPPAHLVVENFFPRPEIHEIADDQDRFYRGECDSTPPFPWPAPRPARNRSRKHPYASFFIPSLAKLLCDGRLAELIHNYAGFEIVRFWQDQLLYEKPGRVEKDLHWHTERSRWLTCETSLMVTAWIPLCDFNLKMGPITLAPSAPSIIPPDFNPDPADLLSMTLRAGDLVLFPWETVHGNPANLGDRPRRAVAAHFCPAEIRYRPHGKFSHVNERLVRHRNGLPDFQDERVCPTVEAVSNRPSKTPQG